MTAGGRGPLAPVLWLAAAALAALWLLPLSTAWGLAPDLGHGWAGPVFVAYLFWERWRQRPGPAVHRRLGLGWWIAGAAVVAVGLPLQLLLQPYPLWPTAVWAYSLLLAFAALAAAELIAGPPGFRWLGGPLLILAGTLPWTSQIDRWLVYPLRVGMADIAAEISNALGHPALAEGTSVRLGTDWIGVDEACGGIRSLQASVMVALFLGEWLRFSWRRRLGLVGIGAAAALLGNFLRILTLSLRAASGAAAARSLHDAAGWLALALSLALTGFAAWRWSRRPERMRIEGGARCPQRAGPAPRPCASGGLGTGRPASEALSAPAVAWIGLVAAGLLLTQGASLWWYARGESAAAARPHWTARLPQEEWSFRPAPLGEAAEEMLRPDAYQAGTWQDAGGRTLSAYYIEWSKGQAARFVPWLHNPTVCLPLAGCDLVGSLGEISVSWSGGEMPFHAYLFRQAGQEMAVAFAVWDTGRNRPLDSGTSAGSWAGWMRAQWRDVREARRSQPAQMLTLAVSGPKDREALLPELRALIAAR